MLLPSHPLRSRFSHRADTRPDNCYHRDLQASIQPIPSTEFPRVEFHTFSFLNGGVFTTAVFSWSQARGQEDHGAPALYPGREVVQMHPKPVDVHTNTWDSLSLQDQPADCHPVPLLTARMDSYGGELRIMGFLTLREIRNHNAWLSPFASSRAGF